METAHNQKKPRKIAVLVETSFAAGRDMLVGISDYIRLNEQWFIHMYPHDFSTAVPPWFEEFPCDGIIARVCNNEIAETIRQKKCPVVDIFGSYKKGMFPSVIPDNIHIGNMAVDHFRKKGFTSFAYVGLSNENWSQDRQTGYMESLAELNHSCSCLSWSKHEEKSHDVVSDIQRIKDWISPLQLPLAIFACSDFLALTIRNALYLLGYAIGRDVAILGVGNDIQFCEMQTPPLSSIDANHRKIGYTAAALLGDLMRGAPAPQEPLKVEPADIVIRESTDFLAVSDNEIQTAITFIRQNATTGISVDDVANACHMSRSVLQRRFRKFFGQTIHDCILQEKTRYAIKLIQETNSSIESIALSSGFQYVQSLNKALNRLYNHSASDYRHPKRNSHDTP